ncbi:MAG: hypothetical protein NT045_05300, partial [Candidatus Aureabacteria bacterium]|nr:hypothetical protein [Candidatus Auribacterota bacterium]
MADPLRSYRALKKWIDSTGCFNDIRLVYHGLGPLGAHMFKHFIPVSAIASAYYGDEVSRYMEAEWGTKIFSYEKMNRVRVNDCRDYYSNFFHDHGPALVAAIEARGGEACLAPFAPSNAIHEFIFTSAPSWRLLTNLKIAQDYFEFKSRLAMEAARIGIPMPPASRVMSFESLDYRRLADSYEGGFVIQTPLSQAG